MRVIVSPSVWKAIDGIVVYLEDNFGYALADEIRAEIENTIYQLEDFPFLWPIDVAKNGTLIRKAQVRNRTIIAYTVDEAAGEVLILDVFAAKTDWK